MRTHAKILTMVAMVTLALVGMAQATPISVTNPMFTDPVVSSEPPGDTLGPITGWACYGNCGLINLLAYPQYDYSELATGGITQAAYSNGSGTLVQYTDYTIKAGDVITLQMDVARTIQGGGGTDGVVSLLIGPIVNTPFCRGQVTPSLATLPLDQWETLTVTYIVPQTDLQYGTQLAIIMWAKDGQNLYTNVHLDVTPEPATMALLAVGGLAALIRRRRK